MKLGIHIKYPLLIIFRYGPKSAAPPGDSGSHYSKWLTISSNVFIFGTICVILVALKQAFYLHFIMLM